MDYPVITKDTVFFFDLDGTLVDTNLANYLAYQKAIGIVTNSECKITFNPNTRLNRSSLITYVPNLSDVEYENIIQEKENIYSYFLPKTKLIDSIVDILFKYSKTNNTYLVTNCREDRALETLNYHNLTDKFNSIVYRQSVANNMKINKYQNAISVLRIKPELVIAFENEELEIADAISAGIRTINPELPL